MRQAMQRGLIWIGLYVLAVILPLIIVLIGDQPASRGFLVEFSAGLGFVGLAMMGLQFGLTARFRWIAGTLGLDNMLQFHRQAGIVAITLVLAHPVILIIEDPSYVRYFNPMHDLRRGAALSLVTIAMITLLVLTLWRRQIRFAYEWWRLTHGILACIILFIGLAHLLLIGYRVAEGWKQYLFIGLVLFAIGLQVDARVIKPLRAKGRPWTITDVKAERDRVWTLTLKPEGHEGIRFRAGQCVWLILGESSYSINQHPFTIASSAEETSSIQITIKELGDYTRTVSRTRPGTVAYLEGPYGASTLDAEKADTPAVFIVGGIGITPAMSMLRTMRDRGGTRPLVLIYGNESWEKIVFRDELDDMRRELNLRIVHVLEKPPEEWSGEQGYITRELLERQLGDILKGDAQYFVCGPDPMMDAVESALRACGVPIGNINSERFNLV